MSRFKRIYIEITNICNFNCPFCSKDGKPKRQMSVEEFKHVINEIKPYTNYIYLHVKGEPLLHSNFEDIIKICDDNNIKVNITTNGSLINKRLDILKNKCIRQINISLQSYKNNIDDILECSNVLSLNKSIVYRFWALDNYNLTDDNRKLYNYILNKYNVKRDGNNIKLSKNIYLQKNKLFQWPNINSLEYSNNYCLGTISHIGILSDGTVIPCCLDSSGIINLGNIFNDSLKNILSSNRFISINKEFKNNKCIEELCKHCTYKNNCN